MYETEIKVELSVEKLQRLLGFIRRERYTDLGVTPQEDLYVEATPSPHGSFDIKRYRADGPTFFYTEKVWEGEGEARVRREIEREITSDEYRQAKENLTPVVRITKDRYNFSANYGGRSLHLSIDNVKFDHSPQVRRFFEAEIIVRDKSEVPETKEFIRRFIAEALGIQVADIVEAPGMFALAYKKL